MSADTLFLAPIQPINEIQIGLPAAPTSTGMTDFGVWLDQELSQLNGQLINTDKEVKQLALGNTDNLHGVMISLEQSRLAFQLALQVRNHLLDGYQELMRMQI